MEQNELSLTIKQLRKEYGLTQEDLAFKSGVGLRFVREMEQGKTTLRMDKVNHVLLLFSLHLGPVPIVKETPKSPYKQ
ncbi:MAG: helix-turn-helix transcriptional regulator [Prevotella histicola]|nr:helix-turn-helix transcriptional regulator [Prevotella histicola]